MPLTTHRASRLSVGLAAAGIAASTVLAPVIAEAGVPPGTCTTQKAAYRAAAATYRQAKVALNAAVQTRKDAVTAYAYDATVANRQVRATAMSEVTRLKGEAAAAKPAMTASFAAQVTCVKPPAPTLTMTNPHVANYGNLFPVADVTYTNVPDGTFFLAVYNDGVLRVRPLAVTFVPVIPRPNPFNPDPRIYQVNGRLQENYLDSRGCAGTTGDNITFALWTGSDGSNPTGTKIAEATVDNPCY